LGFSVQGVGFRGVGLRVEGVPEADRRDVQPEEVPVDPTPHLIRRIMSFFLNLAIVEYGKKYCTTVSCHLLNMAITC
jgi:hypothetical protein